MTPRTARSPALARGLRRWGPLGAMALALAVLWGLMQQSEQIDRAAVAQALRALPAQAVALACALAAASHALYAALDLLARHYTGHRLPTARVLAVGACSYAVNLNLGSLLGGVGVRARLYLGLGLDLGCITRIVGFAVVSNWLGYLAVAALVFTVFTPPLPAGWPLAGRGLQAVGLAALVSLLAFAALCGRWGGRAVHPRFGRSWVLPGPGLAWAQVTLASAHWACMGAVLAVLLEGQVPYGVVLGTLLIAAVAGLIAHIPGGLGVVEAVCLAVLGGQLPAPTLLAALLVYRVVFYWVPLALGAALYGALEARQIRRMMRRWLRPAGPRPPPPRPRH